MLTVTKRGSYVGIPLINHLSCSVTSRQRASHRDSHVTRKLNPGSQAGKRSQNLLLPAMDTPLPLVVASLQSLLTIADSHCQLALSRSRRQSSYSDGLLHRTPSMLCCAWTWGCNKEMPLGSSCNSGLAGSILYWKPSLQPPTTYTCAKLLLS